MEPIKGHINISFYPARPSKSMVESAKKQLRPLCPFTSTSASYNPLKQHRKASTMITKKERISHRSTSQTRIRLCLRNLPHVADPLPGRGRSRDPAKTSYPAHHITKQPAKISISTSTHSQSRTEVTQSRLCYIHKDSEHTGFEIQYATISGS